MLNELDTGRIPLSDISLKDQTLLEDYRRAINSAAYSSAVEKLNTAKFEKGLRASVLNAINNRLKTLELFLLNLTADKDTFYSYEEPSAEQMKGKKFWIQSY